MMTALLAAFTSPIHIGTDWVSMLWMFPLLAAIAIVYKTTKMRVLFWRRFIREVLILFATLSGFMFAAIVVLNLVTWLATS
ncbi:MAG: hypothetical protein GXY41_08045 [Phycisphaerae bacterium]|nr:hypothetical protein [Phycisphaerae bacterium]